MTQISPTRKNGFLERDFTAVLRGVCMLLIVWSHTANEFPQQLAQWHALSLLSVGTYATGIFFLLSGYGLTLSLQRNTVDASYLRARLSRLLVPYVVFYLCYFALDFRHFSTLLPAFLTLSMPQADAWFFKTILALYVLYISLAMWNKRLAPIVVSVGIAAYVAFLMHCGVAGYWWNTLLCFPLGICFACSERLRRCSAGYSFVCLVLFVQIYKKPSLALLGSVACPLLLATAVAVLSRKVRVRGKVPVLSFIGEASIYMYLMEAIPIDFIDAQRVGFLPFVGLGLILTTALTYLARRFELWFRGL